MRFDVRNVEESGGPVGGGELGRGGHAPRQGVGPAQQHHMGALHFFFFSAAIVWYYFLAWLI